MEVYQYMHVKCQICILYALFSKYLLTDICFRWYTITWTKTSKPGDNKKQWGKRDVSYIRSSGLFVPLKEHLPSCWSQSWSWNNLLSPFLRKSEIKVTFAENTCNPPPNKRVPCFALNCSLVVRMLIKNVEGKTLMSSSSKVIYSSFSEGMTLISQQQTNLRVKAHFTSCYNCAFRHKELSKQRWELNVGRSRASTPACLSEHYPMTISCTIHEIPWSTW